MTIVPGEQSSPEKRKPFVMSNFSQRLVTALIALPIILGVSYTGGWPFEIVVSGLAMMGALEFYILARGRPIQGSALVGVPTVAAVLLAFYLHQPVIWQVAVLLCIVVTFTIETLRHPGDVRRSVLQVGMTLAGLFYVGFPSAFLIGLRALPDGLHWLLMVYAITWGTDTFAYFGGRFWGKTPLAPTISPKKTREGAIVGWLGGSICALLVLIAAEKLSIITLLLIAVGPLAAILGDLAESWLKRFFQAKDSHIMGLDILPGHGGVLDRIDALIVVATLCYCTIILFNLAG